MRYWHPLAAETVAQVKNYAPDRIVLLPLYPQFSTTTTGSSIANWHKAAEAGGLNIPTQTLCCYFENSPFVATIATRVLQALDAEPERTTRVLFTAHGLPKKVIDAGDPYQWQIERTADAIVTAIGRPDLDWTVCYQSRVGPLEWIQPYTSDELEQAGDDERSVIVVPIGFISEHSETLVELDIEYRELAEKAGVPHYTRVETVGTDDGFIGGLAQLVETVATQEAPLTSERGSCKCPDMYAGCPHRAG
jgi:ferrochelatase